VSVTIQASCEGAEDLLDHFPDLPGRSVTHGSERVARVLFAGLDNEYYDDTWQHLFEYVEQKFGLADVLFSPLIDQASLSASALEAASYLGKMLEIISEHDEEIPPLYYVEEPSGRMFREIRIGDLRVQAGWNHCVLIDDNEEQAEDLRNRSTLPSPEGSVLIGRIRISDLCGEDFRRMLDIARTSQEYNRKFLLEVL
jgi:hypothetical protein